LREELRKGLLRSLGSTASLLLLLAHRAPMRFKFCGELDAPDWILKEIAIISKISSLRVRMIVQQIINQLLGGTIEYDKVLKFVAEANFEASDIRASLAALNFIVSNAARFDCDDTVLATELAQLGMPKEHCDSLCKPYKENRARLKAKFAEQLLRLPKIDSLDWRVDVILTSDQVNDLCAGCVQLSLAVSQADGSSGRTLAFEASEEKFKVLLAELRTAKAVMDSVRAAPAP